MGAYEYYYPGYLTPTPTNTPTNTPTATPTLPPGAEYDLNTDGRINHLDMFLIASQWQSPYDATDVLKMCEYMGN